MAADRADAPLNVIDLTSNRFDGAQCRALLPKLLTVAREVVLFDCAIGDDGIESIASELSPSSTVATVLDVAFNAITDFGAGSLYTRLKHHNNSNDGGGSVRLSTIVLAGNQISDSVIESLRATGVTVLRQEKPPSE